MALLVTEIFYSIQGESMWSGLPCVFVRLSGCNLRCHYCDTPYAYAPGQPMVISEIFRQAAGFNCARLTITGGEPLLQEETPELVSVFIEKGFNVSMETNGSRDIGLVDRRCIKVLDIKCPSSGMQDHNRMENIQLLGPQDQVKFVIADKSDFHFALSMSKRIASTIDAERMLFSPVNGILPPVKLAAWMLEANAPARLQLQLHKILWPDHDRGI